MWKMLRCLRRRNFPIVELWVFARSSRNIQVDGRTYKVQAISPEGFEGIDRVKREENGQWETCTEKESEEVTMWLEEHRRKRNAKLLQSPHGVFGVMVMSTCDIKFIGVDKYVYVVDALKREGVVDMRKVPIGVVCGTGEYKVELVHAQARKMGLDVEELPVESVCRKVFDALDREGYAFRVIRGTDIKEEILVV